MAFDPSTAQLDADPDADDFAGWVKSNSPGVKASARQAAAEGIVAALRGGDEGAMREILRHSAKVLPQAVRKGIRREWYRAKAKGSVEDYWAEHGAAILHDKFKGRGSWRDQAKRWLSSATDHVHRNAGIRADSPALKALNETLRSK